MTKTADTITADDKAKARQAKAAKDKERRAVVAAAKQALEAANIEFENAPKSLTITIFHKGQRTELSPEQKQRAATYTAGHGGLKGAALAAYILDGKTVKEQIADANAANAQAKKAEKQRQNLTRSNDPEAKELADKAAALVPDVVSTFRPKNAREHLDTFNVALDEGIVAVGRKGADVGVLIDAAQLAQFVAGPNGTLADDERKLVRKAIAELAKDTGLWGRKLAALTLARVQ